MRRIFVIGILLLAGVSQSLAQDFFTSLDTVHIEEVVSYGTLKKYQSGAKIEKISETQFELGQDGNLQRLLSRTLPISFKTDAGGLSTIRVRGTSPDHTSINFGGININSLTLGHSNVSNVPMFLFDEIGVQFGSSSSVNGSGSIGGAIHLGLKNLWTKGFKAEMRIANGSYGEQFYGTKLFFGNGKFESVTRAYYYTKENNFKFINPIKDFETQKIGIEDTQRNADIENIGILQEFNYKFNENEFLTFNVWLEDNWHLIQQKMQTNYYNPDKREEYDDKHIRIWSSYKNRKNPLKYEISGGYVFDNGTHNNNDADTIQTNRVIAEAFIEHDIKSGISYKVGAKATRIRPTVYTYSRSLDHEDRIDFYASYFHRFSSRFTTTLNLRQGFVTDFDVPFTPSLGLKYMILSKEKSILNLTANIAKSYRVPTFNDRFWIPGGNPDLIPEKGMNYELGTKWSYCDGETSGNIKINAFFMNVDHWILWRKGSKQIVDDSGNIIGNYEWYAENVQNVESKGIEVMTDWRYKLFGLPFISGANYTYTSTKRMESLNETNALNRQLEYVPLHSGNFFSATSYKKFDFIIDGSYTDKQFTDEEDKNILDSFFLLNLAVTYKLSINKKNDIKINGMVNNVLDTDYQANWEYAMPGINYRLSLTYNLK